MIDQAARRSKLWWGIVFASIIIVAAFIGFVVT